jgi:hypothetical protein
MVLSGVIAIEAANRIRHRGRLEHPPLRGRGAFVREHGQAGEPQLQSTNAREDCARTVPALTSGITVPSLWGAGMRENSYCASKPPDRPHLGVSY